MPRKFSVLKVNGAGIRAVVPVAGTPSGFLPIPLFLFCCTFSRFVTGGDVYVPPRRRLRRPLADGGPCGKRCVIAQRDRIFDTGHRRGEPSAALYCAQEIYFQWYMIFFFSFLHKIDFPQGSPQF